MNAIDFVFVGLKCRVTALDKSDGQIAWSTKLPGGTSPGFVTLSCDGCHVFACCCGQIHCLDLFSGQLLWTNGLEGHGFGIASICVPGGQSAPTAAAAAQIAAQQAAATS
jgi:hypothetical protein